VSAAQVNGALDQGLDEWPRSALSVQSSSGRSSMRTVGGTCAALRKNLRGPAV
jgi:hypothetical protein